jgi:hypothetical protein
MCAAIPSETASAEPMAGPLVDLPQIALARAPSERLTSGGKLSLISAPAARAKAIPNWATR